MKCERINKYGEKHVVTRIQAALNMYEELYGEFDPDGAIAVHGEYFVNACEAVDVVEDLIIALKMAEAALKTFDVEIKDITSVLAKAQKA